MSEPTPELLLRHAAFVRALARSLVRDAHRADDVEQETWLRWLRRPPPRLESAAGWLAHVVRSTSANARRTDGRRAEVEARAVPAEEGTTPAEDAAQSEILARVAAAVHELDEPYRATLLARYYRGRSARELAREAGLPHATVRSREQRGLARLRARLGREVGPSWALLLARSAGVAPAAPVAWAALVLVVLLLAASGGRYLWSPARVAPSAPTRTAGVAGAADATTGSVEAVESAGGGGRLGVTPSEGGEQEGEDYALVGRTVDPDGRPLAGVRLAFLSPAREARSDEQGRFRVEGLAHLENVTAELAGYRTLYATDPENGMGPFAPMVVTLAPTGALGVTVIDDDGTPLEGVNVVAHPAWEERQDTSGAGGTFQAPSFDAYTDAGGHADVAVWTGMKLELELELPGGSPVPEARSTRCSGGALVLDDGPGQPIVLQPGEPLELVARWGRAFSLHGRVLDGEQPAGACDVTVSDLGYPEDDVRAGLARGRCDEAGGFVLESHPAALRGPLRVEAQRSGPGPRRLLESPDGAHTTTMYSGAMRARLEVGLGGLEQELVLVLERRPGALITGRLLAPDGTAPPMQLFRVSAFDRDGVEVQSGSVSVPGGVFGVFLPEPGSYDLALTCRQPVRDLVPPLAPFALFSGLSAGSDVELHLPDDAPVHLHVSEAPEEGRLLLARFTPSEPRARTSAPRELVVDDPLRWPEEDLGGAWQRFEVELGRMGDESFALGPPGWYGIGFVAAGPKHGEDGARVGTELLYFEGGEVALVLRPPPTGSLRGRWEAAGTREFLGLALLDARGRPVPLRAGSEARALVQPLKASGEFLLRDLATGTYRLRVGALDELAAGNARREIEVEVGPGANPELVLRR